MKGMINLCEKTLEDSKKVEKMKKISESELSLELEFLECMEEHIKEKTKEIKKEL